MSKTIIDSYNGWGIKVQSEHNLCSNFSFDITDPSGHRQHVTMGGDDAQRALERAKELIDQEISLQSNN